MTFLNPIVLIGLAVAAVPLIIHLFNFRKPRRVEFSSLEFIKEVEKSTMQRVRIKQWLLLLLRTLAIAAIVMAFARPTLRGDLAGLFAGTAPVAVAVVVDNSPSMTQRDAGGAYFDQARQLALEVLAGTDSRDEVAIVPVQRQTASSLYPGGPAAASRLDGVAMSGGGRSLLSAIVEASSVLDGSLAKNREIYVIGDFQRSTLLDTLDVRIPAGADVYLLPVGSGRPANIGVADVRVRSRIVEANQPVRITATLVNYGDSRADAYVSSLYLDGERLSQASLDLEPGEEREADFVVSPAKRGWLAGIIETEDDAFPADNRAHFALHVPETRTVLVVTGDGQDPRFVNAALAADPRRVSLAVESIRENALPSRDLSSVDVILLVGPASLSSGESDRLAAFVSAGGGIMWFPSDRPSLDDYNGLFSRLGAGRLTGVSDNVGAGETVDAVDRVDLGHPLFEGILDGSGQSLERPEIYRRASYQPGNRTESSLMEMSSGSPLLQEMRFGRGAVLWLGVGAHTQWSDLPTRGLFVPLLYRALFLLSSSETVAGEQFGQGADGEVLLPGVSEGARLTIETPEGEQVVPESRAGVGGLLVDLSGTLAAAGHYRIIIDDRTERLIAVNPDPTESDLLLESVTGAAGMISQRSDAKVEALADQTSVEAASSIAAARRGAELWNVFLALALLFLVGEMIVAKQWRPESAH